jgi:hypothetical protein
MFHHSRLTARTQGNSCGAYHIRLDVHHPDLDQACGLLSACGGCKVTPAAGTIYSFVTTVVRDNALDLVRRKIGYTVASPSDGHSWWRSDPESQYLDVFGQHARHRPPPDPSTGTIL